MDELEKIRKALKGYPDSDLASLAETLQSRNEFLEERVVALIEANNREVERRRKAEQMANEVQELVGEALVKLGDTYKLILAERALQDLVRESEALGLYRTEVKDEG